MQIYLPDLIKIQTMHFFNLHGKREYLMSTKNKYNYNIIRGPFPCKHSDLLVSLHPWNKKSTKVNVFHSP